MDNNLVGMKELYDINIRLNQPLEIGKRKYDINETILSFERAEIAQIQEQKNHKTARGGFQNNMLIDWETDTQATFALTHGVLSPSTWAILSNSKLNEGRFKSVSYKEQVNVVEDDDYWFCLLKYIPNHVDGDWGIQGNPDNEPMPMGRKPWLPLKPLPPSKDHFIFCYDMETGCRIMNFEVCGNMIKFKGEHRKVMVDYTFDYEDKIRTLEVGNRLLNGFLRLQGKMSVKDEKSGEVTTAILEMPKIKLSSSLSIRLGKNYEQSTVSDFFFTGYPDESRRREDQTIAYVTFLDKELTGDYI